MKSISRVREVSHKLSSIIISKGSIRSLITILGLTVFLGSGYNSFCQPGLIDSLRTVLKNTEADTARVDLMNEISKIWANQNNDSALWYADQSLALSKEINYLLGQVYSSSYKGHALRSAGRYLEALETFEMASLVADSIGEELLLASTYNEMGLTHNELGNYTVTVENYNKALRIFERTNSNEGISKVYNNLGNVYADIGDFETALDFYQKGQVIDRESQNTVGLAISSNNIGMILRDLGRLDSALEYHQLSLSIADSFGIAQGVAINLTNIGVIYDLQGKRAKAIDAITRSIDICENQNYPGILVEALGALSEVYLNNNDLNEAEKLLNRALNLAKEIGSQEGEKKALEGLVKVHERKGDFKSALQVYKAFEALSDSMYNEQTTKEIARLEADYEFQQQKDSIQFANDRKLLLLNNELETKNLEQLGAFIALVFLFIIVAGLVYSYRRIQAINKKLELLNKEKDHILSVVSHDLKTPFHQVKSVLHLMDSNLLNEEEQKMLSQEIGRNLDQGLALIGDLTMIHANKAEQAYALETSPVDLKEFLPSFISYYQSLAEQKKIDIKLQQVLPALTLVTEESLLKRILDNILMNAIKYSKAGNKVTMEVVRREEAIDFIVEDDGPGIPDADKQKIFEKYSRLKKSGTAGEQSSGLGLYIVKALVKRLNGSVWVEDAETGGSRFIVRLPLNQSA